MAPEQETADKLSKLEGCGLLILYRYPGQVGWIVPHMRQLSEARVGDTIYMDGHPVEPLPGFKPYSPVVYAGLYPTSPDEFNQMRDAMDKLLLTDASVSSQMERRCIVSFSSSWLTARDSPALGIGFRCGFLGGLHMEVFVERLLHEHGVEVIVTQPTVPYQVFLKDGTAVTVTSAAEFPDASEISYSLEPRAKLTVIFPSKFIGDVMKLLQNSRGEQHSMSHLPDDRIVLVYDIPMAFMISGLYGKLKEVTAGYASIDYEDAGTREEQIVKVTILLNGEPVEPLSYLAHASEAVSRGRVMVDKLKTLLNRQLFAVAIQASIGSKVIARSTLSALRKDVTAKCYGGDVTRKMKLLEKQKEGKKRLREFGKVKVEPHVFTEVLKSR